MVAGFVGIVVEINAKCRSLTLNPKLMSIDVVSTGHHNNPSTNTTAFHILTSSSTASQQLPQFSVPYRGSNLVGAQCKATATQAAVTPT